tara:strand:- start:41 stop:211 length:171 start_codon:yes stop_codon:yes gene_type:complete
LKTNLTTPEVSFLLDLLDCTIEKGSASKDIFKYEKWNKVNSYEIHKELMRMWEETE